MGHGLAATCFLQARSSDPLYAPAWEGMAAMAGTRATGVALRSRLGYMLIQNHDRWQTCLVSKGFAGKGN